MLLVTIDGKPLTNPETLSIPSKLEVLTFVSLKIPLQSNIYNWGLNNLLNDALSSLAKLPFFAKRGGTILISRKLDYNNFILDHSELKMRFQIIQICQSVSFTS